MVKLFSHIILITLGFTFLIPIQEAPRSNYRNKNLNKIRHITIDGQHYYLGPLSGDVYKLTGDSLTRIDKTPDHRLNIESYVFKHRDTIFKYGGYGYWSNRNFIIYYDFNSSEWELYSTNNTDFVPHGSNGGTTFYHKDQVVFFGGEKVNSFNQLETIPNEEVIKFDFHAKKFQYLGALNKNLESLEYILNYEDFVVMTKGHFLYEIYPLKNKITVYEKTPVTLNLVIDQENYYDGEYYQVSVSENHLPTTKKVSLSRDEFFGKKIKSMKLYEEEGDYQKSIYFLIFVLIGSSLFFYFKRKKNLSAIIISKNKIVKGGSSFKLDDYAYEVIVSLAKEGYIYNTDVLELIERKDLTLSHNIKLKGKFIEKLNIHLKIILGLKEKPIINSKDDVDRRISVFSITDEFAQILRKIKIE